MIVELARCYPLPRTSPNATPVADILKAFSHNSPIGGTRFAHGRRLQDDEAVAKITGMQVLVALRTNGQQLTPVDGKAAIGTMQVEFVSPMK